MMYVTESNKDKWQHEVTKRFPEMEQLQEILQQIEPKAPENANTYEVKTVNKQQLEAMKRSALSTNGTFEKHESNESKKNKEVLDEMKAQLTAIEEKLNVLIHYVRNNGQHNL